MEEMKYEKKLWGKVEFLHERYKKKKTIINNFKEMIARYQDSCLQFSRSIQFIIDKNYQLLNENNTSIFKALKKLMEFLSVQSQEYTKLCNNIAMNILQSVLKLNDELFAKEKNLHNYYALCQDRYKNSKDALDKAQKAYLNNIKICEKNIKSAKIVEKDPQKNKEEREKKFTKVKKSLDIAKSCEEKYSKSVNEAEKMRLNKNDIEKQILDFYEQIDHYNFDKIKELLGIFIDLYNNTFNNLYGSLTQLKNEYNNINIKNDIELFLDIKNENKPDNPIVFIPYVPEANLKTTSLTGDENETNRLILDYEVMKNLKRLFINICNDLNMEEEEKKYRLRILSLKIFQDGNASFSKEEKAELIALLKNPQFRNYFIINTSKQRTKSRYKRSEKALDDLGDIFNIILAFSENEQNYEEARDCIIISQTFYAEIMVDNKPYKKYLFEYIIDNKWLKNLSFWEGIIDLSIKKELEKSEETNKEAISKETEIQKKERISNVCFSHMLPLTNNMIEFFFKRDIIKKTVDLFVKKYDIDEKNSQMIYDNIENTPEPALPLSKRKKKSDIEKKRAFSYKSNKKNNVNIAFEIIDKKEAKRTSSLNKYMTNINLEDKDKEKLNKINIGESYNLELTKGISFGKEQSNLLEKVDVNKHFATKKTFNASTKNKEDKK